MGKNNRKRRSRKLAQKRERLKRKTIQEKNIASDSMSFYELTDPFEGLGGDARIKAISELAARNKSSLDDLFKSYDFLFRECDSIRLVSLVCRYGQMLPVGKNGEGIQDREIAVHQWQIEFLQAMILRVDPSEFSRTAPNSDQNNQIWSSCDDLASFSALIDLPPNIDVEDDKQIALHELQSSLRASTRSVRNWGYHSQVKRLSQELYSVFDEQLYETLQCTCLDLFSFFDLLTKEIEKKSQSLIDLIHQLSKEKSNLEMTNTFFQRIETEPGDLESFLKNHSVTDMKKEQLLNFFISFLDTKVDEIFTFRIDDLVNKSDLGLASMQSIVTYFSIYPGGLIGIDPQHLLLANPVWKKPLIRISHQKFICFVPNCFFSFIFPCMDSLLQSNVKSKLISTRRASYAELKVKEIVAEKFPDSNIVSNVKWKIDGNEYETDLIVSIDSHLIIIEIKSGKISESGLRGAPDRSKRHLNEIFISPNIQSSRLEQRLRFLKGNPEVDDPIKEVLPAELADIEKIIRLSVSLEDFGAIQSNLKRFENTGWLPDDFSPCPTVNLADLETIFEILDHPVQIIHYLTRRQELEESFKYKGDELDLLGLYLDTLFNFGDLGRTSSQVIITGMSTDIDNFYNAVDAGFSREKPTPKVSILFTKIFKQLESRKQYRWTEIGVILNMCSPEDQRKFSRALKVLRKNVVENWRREGHNNMVILRPSLSDRLAICFVLFNDGNSHRKKEFVDHGAALTLEPEHVDSCLLVAINIDRSDAYNLLAIFQKKIEC